MLVAEISPSAQKSIEVSPFSSTTINLSYMTAIARPYVPGAESTNFQVQFGTIGLDELGVAQSFSGQLNSQITLTKEELSTWGTDDDTLLSIVASKLGVSVIEFIEISQDSF